MLVADLTNVHLLQQKMLLWSDVFDSSGVQVGEAMQNYLTKFPETKVGLHSLTH